MASALVGSSHNNRGVRVGLGARHRGGQGGGQAGGPGVRRDAGAPGDGTVGGGGPRVPAVTLVVVMMLTVIVWATIVASVARFLA